MFLFSFRQNSVNQQLHNAYRHTQKSLTEIRKVYRKYTLSSRIPFVTYIHNGRYKCSHRTLHVFISVDVRQQTDIFCHKYPMSITRKSPIGVSYKHEKLNTLNRNS